MQLLVDTANDPTNYRGIDKYGNSWHIKLREDKSQDWVRSRDGMINEGGVNLGP